MTQHRDPVELGARIRSHQPGDVVHITLERDGKQQTVDVTLGSTNGRNAAAPEVIARGFAEPGPLLDEMREEAHRVLLDLIEDDVTEIKLIQEHLHDSVGQLIYDRTGRRPMILPVVVEV